jgi:hypothetical protein
MTKFRNYFSNNQSLYFLEVGYITVCYRKLMFYCCYSTSSYI